MNASSCQDKILTTFGVYFFECMYPRDLVSIERCPQYPMFFFLVLYCLFHCKEDNLESLQFLQELGYKLKRRVNKLVDACVVTVVQSRRGCSIL